MPTDFATTSSTDPAPGDSTAACGVDAPDLRLFVFALFFVFGGITSLNDVIIPKLKELFTLSYAQVMLVQTAFFAAYFVVSIPAALAPAAAEDYARLNLGGKRSAPTLRSLMRSTERLGVRVRGCRELATPTARRRVRGRGSGRAPAASERGRIRISGR